MVCESEVYQAFTKRDIILKVCNMQICHYMCISPTLCYSQGHYETTPYNPDSLRSIYHVREFDVRKLLLVSMMKCRFLLQLCACSDMCASNIRYKSPWISCYLTTGPEVSSTAAIYSIF